jgi:hypothetical protein
MGGLRMVEAGLAAILSMGAVPSPAQEAQVPNLVPWPTDAVFIGAESGARVLMVELVVENIGSHPLSLRGELRTDGGADAFQCVGWDGALCSSWVPAGAMIFRRQTGCWALEQLAGYELRRLVDGLPDMSVDGLVASKVPSNGYRDAVRDGEGPGDEVPNYPVCVGFLRQGLSPGWMARFEGDEEGHAIPLGNVADGAYALVVEIDPGGLIVETDESDNTTWSIVEIAGDEVTIG